MGFSAGENTRAKGNVFPIHSCNLLSIDDMPVGVCYAHKNDVSTLGQSVTFNLM